MERYTFHNYTTVHMNWLTVPEYEPLGGKGPHLALNHWNHNIFQLKDTLYHWIDDFHLFSEDEMLAVFQRVIIINNWSFNDVIKAIPHFPENPSFEYSNRTIKIIPPCPFAIRACYECEYPEKDIPEDSWDDEYWNIYKKYYAEELEYYDFEHDEDDEECHRHKDENAYDDMMWYVFFWDVSDSDDLESN